MKIKIVLAAMSAVLLTSLLTSARAQDGAAARQQSAPAANWKQIAIPPLPPFNPQQPTRVVLANGMVVFLTENHELPLISGEVRIRGGSDSDPADKVGLVELYGESWRTGGTEKLSGDELDDYLEARAAKVETSGGSEDTSINFDCLKADFPDVLQIVEDLLRHPAFREDKLALAKKQMNSNISRRNDETSDIAEMQTDILGYGKNSAYARVPEYATVAAVTREDLLRWHRQHATPNNIILGIVGDFDSKAMEATLRKTFGDWPKGEQVEEPKFAIDPASPGIYLVNKSDVNQSKIRMISMGIQRNNPDYFALQVMNQIFGGGFSSRLFVNLRTKAGLAYSVGGGVGSNWDHPGLTVLQIGTKTETTIEAIKGLWAQVELLKKDPPSELEMKRAKDQILNSFIFNFDTPAKVQREQMTYEFYGYPKDFLEQYRAEVEKVTAADVTRVANQYVHKEDFKVLVIGNSAEFEKQLAELGKVTPVDTSIPAPQAETAKPSGGNADGTAVVARLAQALGSSTKVASVKTLRQNFTLIEQGMQVKMVQSVVYPDKRAQSVSLPQGELLQVITPAAGYAAMGSMVRDLPDEQRDIDAATLKRDFLNVIQHLDDSKYSFTLSGKESLGGSEATVVDVNADGAPTRWWIAADGKLLQEQFSEEGDSGPELIIIKYSEWKSFDGLQYPTKYELRNATTSETTTMTLDAMEVNAAVDPKLFERPQQ